MALCGAGTSSLCVNGSVDMTGRLTGLGGSTYRNYAPYADAPEEGEFDWGGFARNLVMGLAVGAACIAMSLLLPGIGTIAAGALMGAGMGAISASVAGAVGDYSSGNVRSTEEAIRDVAIAAISGAITGAVGVKFPGMNRLVEGGVDTTVATVERAAYAALDGDMTLEEKLAYIFDPGQMAVDFVTGVLIGEAVDGIGKKLPSAWFKKGFGKESEIWDSQVSGARGEYCFGVDGNEIPCITDYYEVDDLFAIEEARFLNEPQFYKVVVENGSELYVSTGNIRQSQFAGIVDNSSGNIAILSGMHGGADGQLLPEFNGIQGTQLLDEDMIRWGGVDNINIYDVSGLGVNDVKKIIDSNKVIVCGWCFSERSQLLLQALGKGDQL